MCCRQYLSHEGVLQRRSDSAIHNAWWRGLGEFDGIWVGMALPVYSLQGYSRLLVEGKWYWKQQERICS